jgi:hypothetical protein
MSLVIPGERLSLQCAITYDAVFNCLLDPIAKGALKCKSIIEWSVREFDDMGTHKHRSLDSGHGSDLGTVGGFEQVHQHVRAGSHSRDCESAEPKYCARHDVPAKNTVLIDPVEFSSRHDSLPKPC